MGDDVIEDPLQLLGRLRLRREEYCQRLLTMLILAGPYPRWNSRSRLSKRGTWFLQGLDALCFGEAAWDEQPLFVDEFDLPKRHEEAAGCAPDYGRLWADRVWMVELKTERASHRPAQLPGYLELGAYHYPSCRMDLTYLTPSMPLAPPPLQPGIRFAHITWDRVLPLLEETWGDGDECERRVTAMLHAALESIGGSWRTWRAEQLTAGSPTTSEPAVAEAERPDMVETALGLAEATAQDGRQRAVDHPSADLEVLQQLRLATRQAICAAPADTPIRYVLPWLWNAATSTGHALTPTGQETGYELRLVPVQGADLLTEISDRTHVAPQRCYRPPGMPPIPHGLVTMAEGEAAYASTCRVGVGTSTMSTSQTCTPPTGAGSALTSIARLFPTSCWIRLCRGGAGTQNVGKYARLTGSKL